MAVYNWCPVYAALSVTEYDLSISAHFKRNWIVQRIGAWCQYANETWSVIVTRTVSALSFILWVHDLCTKQTLFFSPILYSWYTSNYVTLSHSKRWRCIIECANSKRARKRFALLHAMSHCDLYAYPSFDVSSTLGNACSLYRRAVKDSTVCTYFYYYRLVYHMNSIVHWLYNTQRLPQPEPHVVLVSISSVKCLVDVYGPDAVGLDQRVLLVLLLLETASVYSSSLQRQLNSDALHSLEGHSPHSIVSVSYTLSPILPDFLPCFFFNHGHVIVFLAQAIWPARVSLWPSLAESAFSTSLLSWLRVWTAFIKRRESRRFSSSSATWVAQWLR